MKAKPIASRKLCDQRVGALGLAAASLVLAALIGLRALDTGSLQQYFLVFLLIAAGRFKRLLKKETTKHDT